MGNVEHDAGRRHAQRIEDRVEGVGAEVVDLIERGRRGQQAETVGAFRQQAFHVGGIEPIGREYRVRNPLHRILIVVEAGGAEREVEIDDDGIQREIARDRPGHIVRDGGRADAAFGTDDGDHPADRDRLGRREQAADRAHHIEDHDRPDDVVVDATAHQFTIRRDIAGAADHDDTGAGIADGRELIEAGEDVVAALGFQDDDVRRRRLVIGIDRGFDAAHMDRQMGLGEAAVFGRPSRRRRGRIGRAEGLHRYARRRRDVIVGVRGDVELVFGVLTGAAAHLPVSLSLAFSASG